MNRSIPTDDEVRAAVIARSNWGRWGADDQRGTINLITAERKAAAARLVTSGRTVSLARPLGPAPGAANPPVHIVWGGGDGTEGGAGDWLGMHVHSRHYTHVDALNHFIGPRGAWNGRRPDELFRHANVVSPGALWGSIEQWSDGVFTRGVLLDVPSYRGEPFVTVDRPVHGWELAAVAAAQGVEVRPGDALVVHGGRTQFEKTALYGDPPRPGLHGSCVEYFREVDCAALVWDMSDYRPGDAPMRHSQMLVHYLGISELGLAIIDNAVIDPLAHACQAEGRYEFLFVIAPLRIPDGTGSPVNPLALF